MNRDITSKNIQGIADLVICAPVKQGFIDAFENVTYETRLKIAAKTLDRLRVAACEYELIKPFTNVVDRIQSLLSFRIGIIGDPPARQLVLSATFDRPWEPYIRSIWNPLGSFLDLLLCNCEGYISAVDHSFRDFAQWVRDHQVDSSIFYASSPLTVSDQVYLEQFERLQREGKSNAELTTFAADDPEKPAAAVRDQATLLTPTHDPEIQAQFLTMACQALAVLYRLADYYPPDRIAEEGKYLLRAARDLLKGWNTKDENQLPG